MVVFLLDRLLVVLDLNLLVLSLLPRQILVGGSRLALDAAAFVSTFKFCRWRGWLDVWGDCLVQVAYCANDVILLARRCLELLFYFLSLFRVPFWSIWLARLFPLLNLVLQDLRKQFIQVNLIVLIFLVRIITQMVGGLSPLQLLCPLAELHEVILRDFLNKLLSIFVFAEFLQFMQQFRLVFDLLKKVLFLHAGIANL